MYQTGFKVWVIHFFYTKFRVDSQRVQRAELLRHQVYDGDFCRALQDSRRYDFFRQPQPPIHQWSHSRTLSTTIIYTIILISFIFYHSQYGKFYQETILCHKNVVYMKTVINKFPFIPKPLPVLLYKQNKNGDLGSVTIGDFLYRVPYVDRGEREQGDQREDLVRIVVYSYEIMDFSLFVSF